MAFALIQTNRVAAKKRLATTLMTTLAHAQAANYSGNSATMRHCHNSGLPPEKRPAIKLEPLHDSAPPGLSDSKMSAVAVGR